MKNCLKLTAVLFLSAAVSAAAQEVPGGEVPVELIFRHNPGDVIHADAVVRESVYINGIHVHDALIGESSVSRVVSTDGEGGGVLDADFRTEERIEGWPLYAEWTSTESVRYSRDILGTMILPDNAARPVLRSMPVFPGRPVVPGQSWSAPAEEVHLFRIGDIQAGPYRTRIPVAYEYLGRETAGGRDLARIGIQYQLHHSVTDRGEPVRLVSGRSEQILLWDLSLGMPYRRTEDFEFLMMMTDGTVREFRGSQEVVYRVTRELDRDADVRRIGDELADIGGLEVSADERGVRLVIEDPLGGILFEPESADIPPERMAILARIGGALVHYGDRDLLIVGHTAHFGTAEGRYRLSLDRAGAVARALFPDGYEGPGRLFLRGAGSDEPAGSDRENRRVEIFVLD